jgi:alpha-beta hydrolase superfamily lysophospholipase
LLSTKNSAKQKRIATICTENNIAYFRIDHTGCGESEGLLTETTLLTRVNDILSAADILKKTGLTSNSYALFGSSMGGATCIAAWNKLVDSGFNMKGIVTLAAPVMGKTITESAIANQQELEGIPLSFYKENMQFNLTDCIKSISNIMIIHGDNDEIVPVVNAGILFENAQKPKKLLILPGGDHRLSNPVQLNQFIEEASQWLTGCF